MRRVAVEVAWAGFWIACVNGFEISTFRGWVAGLFPWAPAFGAVAEGFAAEPQPATPRLPATVHAASASTSRAGRDRVPTVLTKDSLAPRPRPATA